jgi:hypothetical protein
MAIGGSLWPSIHEESELDAAFSGTAGAGGRGTTDCGGGCPADWLEWELDDDLLAGGNGCRAAGAAGAGLAGADGDGLLDDFSAEAAACGGGQAKQLH